MKRNLFRLTLYLRAYQSSSYLDDLQSVNQFLNQSVGNFLWTKDYLFGYIVYTDRFISQAIYIVLF